MTLGTREEVLPLRLETVWSGRRVTVFVEGDLGRYEGTLFDDTLAVLMPQAAEVIVDVSGAHVGDTATLDQLGRIGRRALEWRSHVAVAGIPDHLWALMERCGATAGLVAVAALEA